MNDNPADAITDRLIAGARDGFDSIARELQTRIKAMVNIPDGGTPSRPIHSKPGEPPRRETGVYRNSWGAAVEVEGDSIKAITGTPMELGLWLEFGTGRMEPRPHASKLAAEFGGEVVSRVREALAGAL